MQLCNTSAMRSQGAAPTGMAQVSGDLLAEKCEELQREKLQMQKELLDQRALLAQAGAESRQVIEAAIAQMEAALIQREALEKDAPEIDETQRLHSVAAQPSDVLPSSREFVPRGDEATSVVESSATMPRSSQRSRSVTITLPPRSPTASPEVILRSPGLCEDAGKNGTQQGSPGSSASSSLTLPAVDADAARHSDYQAANMSEGHRAESFDPARLISSTDTVLAIPSLSRNTSCSGDTGTGEPQSEPASDTGVVFCNSP